MFLPILLAIIASVTGLAVALINTHSLSKKSPVVDGRIGDLERRVDELLMRAIKADMRADDAEAGLMECRVREAGLVGRIQQLETQLGSSS